jgi:hypothetical protein
MHVTKRQPNEQRKQTMNIGFKHFKGLQWYGVAIIVSLPVMVIGLLMGLRPPLWGVPLAANIGLAVWALLFIEYPGKEGFKPRDKTPGQDDE